MSEAKKKYRIELIDITKAITIILVILGHTTGNLDTPMYRRLLYTFHMPLFFFLSGMSTKPGALLLCAVIERYVPQLLGQFPRYPDKV
ncbi:MULTISPECIES: acyltransferase family protein [unclassified Butyrivibrio]|uniref:acyltransferase family protein n=1 Tax=unclassified Butyrivibrio TaxID=2639466 RepID=UPI00047D9673